MLASTVHQLLELVVLGPLLVLATAYKLCRRQSLREIFEQPTLNGDVATVLLHGAGSNDAQFVVARAFLSGPVVSFDYVLDRRGNPCRFNTPPEATIHRAAAEVGYRLLRIQAETGVSTFNLVGHSLGGVVAMVYAELLAKGDDIVIEKVVTINAPLLGTPFVAFARRYVALAGRVNDEMAEGGKVVACAAKMARASMASGERRYFHVNCADDLVVPPSHGSLGGPSAVYCHGHFGAMVDPRVWQLIQGWIDDEGRSPAKPEISPRRRSPSSADGQT